MNAMPHPIHAVFERAVRLYFDHMADKQTRCKRGAFGMKLLCKAYPGLTTVFGWEGDRHAPIAFLDGSFLLRDRGNVLIHFGIERGQINGKVGWKLREHFLPCPVSSFAAGDLRVTIESFADCCEIDGTAFEIAYSRLTLCNTGAMPAVVPACSTYLVPLTPTPDIVPPGETVTIDFAVGADRFGAKTAYPSDDALREAGSWETHYAHMREYWLARLSEIAEPELPDKELEYAYKAGYIYMMIVKDGDCLHVGENGYDAVFDHDVIGMTTALVTMGDFRHFRAYTAHILDRVQYPDARWKYSLPFAVYLLKTGDTAFVRAVFPTIRDNVHTIEKDRDARGWMQRTNAIDSLGFWTVDDWSALTGLTAFHYICTQLGETEQAQWAQRLYDRLLDVCNAQIGALQNETGIDYIPISLTQTNEAGPRSDPHDANALSMFLFGRWAWDAFLLGAPQRGVMLDAIDRTYEAAAEKRRAVSDSDVNFGGYPHGWYCSAYNAGYGSAALRGKTHRDVGIRAYQFMIRHAMSGPYAWWEGVHPPQPDSPWNRPHASGGGGSCPHMWGQSTASKVLLDALIAEKADGTLLLCRGVPEEWKRAGTELRLRRFPVRGGRVELCVSFDESGARVTLHGDVGGRRIEHEIFGKLEQFSVESGMHTFVFSTTKRE